MNMQQKRIKMVLERMITLSMEDTNYAEAFSTILEDGLSEIRDEDGFGTEAQSDPRGDGREGSWSMKCVQGVDRQL